jgi:hypothetical protein
MAVGLKLIIIFMTAGLMSTVDRRSSHQNSQVLKDSMSFIYSMNTFV